MHDRVLLVVFFYGILLLTRTSFDVWKSIIPFVYFVLPSKTNKKTKKQKKIKMFRISHSVPQNANRKVSS